ncbi:hypothetical protein OEZ86_003450 [Tetradesmus obliquus]|nr:hypothetical protein OEZ86_003450 [Tetradesmus obliquus]
MVCQAATPAVQQAAAPRLLDEQSGPKVLQQLDTIIFDCDGVLWRGSDTFTNAVEALHVMRQQGKRLLFVTNNSSKSRAQYVKKFQSLGMQVDSSEIVSSSYTAAAYLSSIGFGQSLQPGKHVLLLGSQGTADELAAAGLQVLDAKQLQLPVLDSVDAMLQMQLDERIGAVVLGWDCLFNYQKLVYASACLRELPGCLYVATNLDHADYIGNDRMMPGTGALVAALQVASGVEPVNVGKGGAWLFPYLLAKFQLQPSRTAVVGDRLDTDIAMGKQGGLVTLLPLTGVTTMQGALSAASREQPDFIMPSVAALAGLPSS